MKSRDACIAELADHRFEPCWTVTLELIEASLESARKKLETVKEGELKALQGRIAALKQLRKDMGGNATESEANRQDRSE